MLILLTEFISHRSSHAKHFQKWVICLLLSTAAFSACFSQSSNDASSKFFSNLNAGFGFLYGGFGGNLEAGYGHFSGYLSSGYATRRVVDNTTIQPTFNYQAGLRYYFNAKSEVLFPRVGIAYGWITNYYSESIGTMSYDQHVQGLSVHVGAQFYSPDGIVFNFDVGVSSKYVITKPDTHPAFFPIYVRPNIGIGYDLTRLLSGNKRSKQIKNKEINPFGA